MRQILSTAARASMSSNLISRRLALTLVSSATVAVATKSAWAGGSPPTTGQAAACTRPARPEIEQRVTNIVVEHLGVDRSKVSESSKFVKDLGADSLDKVELVMAFEEEFDCEIPDDQAERIVTVGDAIDYLMRTVCTKA